MDIYEKIKKEFKECAIGTYKEKKYICVLLPYENSNYSINSNEGLLSRYSWGKDYHLVLKEKLEKITKGKYELFIDSKELNERKVAEHLGLGEIGLNCLLLNKRYGTFNFIGIIKLNDDYIIEEQTSFKEVCLKCGVCIKSCPSNALEGKFSNIKCMSAVTQQKKSLTLEEIQNINETIWGCDICQVVCPINKNIEEEYIDDMKKNTIAVDLKEIFQMTNKEFKEKYKDKACTWRGKLVMQRNAACISFNKDIKELKEDIQESITKNKVSWYVDTIKTILNNWE